MRPNKLGRTRFYVLFALLLTAVCCNSAFAQGDKKTAYAILLDNTGSLRSQFPKTMAFGKGIVHRTCQRGPISIFSFASAGRGQGARALVKMGVDWTQDENVLNKYLDEIYIQPGQTTLLDAIYAMAEKLNDKVDSDKNAINGKVIFVVTDGEDRVSRINETKLFKFLRESAVTVYAVGLVDDLESAGRMIGKSPKDRAVEFLNHLTKETGGGVILPKGGQPDVDALLGKLLP